jgi:hypothetical protein
MTWSDTPPEDVLSLIIVPSVTYNNANKILFRDVVERIGGALRGELKGG